MVGLLPCHAAESGAGNGASGRSSFDDRNANQTLIPDGIAN
jgi:hypothetical protein